MSSVPARRGISPAVQYIAALLLKLPPVAKLGVVFGLLAVGYAGWSGVSLWVSPAGPGPGSYVPAPPQGPQAFPGPSTQLPPVVVQPPITQLPPSTAPVPTRTGRVITPDMMPAVTPTIPDRAFATMPFDDAPSAPRSRPLNLN